MRPSRAESATNFEPTHNVLLPTEAADRAMLVSESTYLEQLRNVVLLRSELVADHHRAPVRRHAGHTVTGTVLVGPKRRRRLKFLLQIGGETAVAAEARRPLRFEFRGDFFGGWR